MKGSAQKVVATVSSFFELAAGRYGKSPRTGKSCPWLPGLAALVIAIVAAGLYGEPQTQCDTTPATAQEASRFAENTPMAAAQGAAILRELRAIRQLLENETVPGMRARRIAGPQRVRMRIESGWHELGSAHAPVTMVEFTDLQCPFCRRFETTTFANLKKDYINAGKLRFIARDLPLPMHPYALGAAEAARCAGDQGKFWPFRDAVLNDQVPPTRDVLLKHARELGLNVQRFQACLNDGKYRQQIQADQANAAALGIRGTPTFVIGRVEDGWLEGLSVTGARSVPFFQQEIEAMLNESSPGQAKKHPAGGASPIQAPGFVGNR